jgi:hypothetical protein
MRIACLHTAESNVAVFAEAARGLGIAEGALSHAVRPDFLRAAEYTGGLTAEIEHEAAAALVELAEGADAVLLTCSTIGPAATRAGAIATVPVLRADAALAEQAVRRYRALVVLCAAESALEPTTRLFDAAARRAGVAVPVSLVPGAWPYFREGDVAAYRAAIAEAADDAYDAGADLVALAQASMSGAAALVRRGPAPLTSPPAGLAAAIAAMSSLARRA